MGYGLREFGSGTGKYTPESSTTMRENDILNKAVKEAKTKFKDIYQLKIHGGGYQRSGIPDVYVAIGGISIWVEFKRPGADTTALQLKTLNELDSLGVYCGTAESVETYIGIIEEVLELEGWVSIDEEDSLT